jgi:hypothetical protein
MTRKSKKAYNKRENQIMNNLKRISLMMCFIAALSIFTLPVDAAEIASQFRMSPWIRVKQSIPITLSVPVVCNVGEVVDLSGRFHAVITFRRQPFLKASVNVYTQGVAGTGEITGRTFQGNQNISTTFGSPLFSLLNGQANFSTRVAFLVTGAPGPDGSVPSFELQAVLNLRFHANGTVTVKLNNFTTDCGDGAGF